jgi:hypothetical protein
MSMVLLSREVSGILSIMLENFHTVITSTSANNNNDNNFSMSFVIDNYTIDSKIEGFEIDMWFHIPHYDSIMPIYYTSLSSVKLIDRIAETKTLSNKIEITLMSDEILVVPKVDYQPHGYYHIQALLVEEGFYKIYIRLECGSVDYMTIDRKLLKNDTYRSYSLESRRVVNNFEIPIVNNNSFRLKESMNNNYCSSTQAFHGRFHINSSSSSSSNSSFNYYDTNQHDGDLDFTFQPYGCKLRDTSNSVELLGLLSNQHIIFLGDSTMEAVYRGVLERMYGPNTFIYEYNTPEWREVSALCSNQSRLNKRWFDFDHSDIRLSFMFDGAPSIYHNNRGAIVEDFTTSSDWKFFRAELHRIITESLDRCRPITMLFNSGLHDIGSRKELLKASLFQINLKKAFLYLRSTVSTLQSKRSSNITCPVDLASESSYFWVNTIAPFGSQICTGFMVRYLNEIASHVANKHGFRVLDVHSLVTGTYC